MGSDSTNEDLVSCWPAGGSPTPTSSPVPSSGQHSAPPYHRYGTSGTCGPRSPSTQGSRKVVADRVDHFSVVVALDTCTFVPEEPAWTRHREPGACSGYGSQPCHARGSSPLDTPKRVRDDAPSCTVFERGPFKVADRQTGGTTQGWRYTARG